jgi:hypothetical protein
MERPALGAMIGPNLLKTGTNSPAISSLSKTVAEMLQLGLMADAIRSQSAGKRARVSGERR